MLASEVCLKIFGPPDEQTSVAALLRAFTSQNVFGSRLSAAEQLLLDKLIARHRIGLETNRHEQRREINQSLVVETKIDTSERSRPIVETAPAD